MDLLIKDGNQIYKVNYICMCNECRKRGMPELELVDQEGNYVDYIKNKVLCDDDIYKGENSDEDISLWSEDAIWNHLKNKIYDSTLTIVLISPNMKETGKWQRSQWIPWEISFSVRETTRNNRTSHRNALLVVILPDKSGSYDYYNKNNLFPILNRKYMIL